MRPGRLVEVGEGDVNDVRVAWVHRNVRPVGGGDGGWGAPGATAVGGLDDVGGCRAGVEDDRVDAAVGAVGDAGVAAGGLHAVEGGVARSPGGAAVGGTEDTDAGGLAVVGGADGVQADRCGLTSIWNSFCPIPSTLPLLMRTSGPYSGFSRPPSRAPGEGMACCSRVSYSAVQMLSYLPWLAANQASE